MREGQNNFAPWCVLLAAAPVLQIVIWHKTQAAAAAYSDDAERPANHRTELLNNTDCLSCQPLFIYTRQNNTQ